MERSQKKEKLICWGIVILGAIVYLPLIPMILSMVLGATVIRRRFGYKTAVLFNLCMFTMPQLLEYGVQLRMYSWAFFAVLGSGLFAYEVIKERTIKIFLVQAGRREV